jgi:hypothetical protein
MAESRPLTAHRELKTPSEVCPSVILESSRRSSIISLDDGKPQLKGNDSVTSNLIEEQLSYLEKQLVKERLRREKL